MTGIIQQDRSLIPACDVPLEVFEGIVRETGKLEVIGGYKIGFALTGRPGYDAVVRLARRHTNKPLIFDAQKWGTDIPDTARAMLSPLKESGIGNVILFPQSGPITEYEWIKTAQELGFGVFVGGEMTHPGYREGDEIKSKKDYHAIFRDELGMNLPTGFIRRDAPDEIYEIAARMGVKNFIVPGNKPESIMRIRRIIEEEAGVKDASYASPGLVAQGGDISEGAIAAGPRWHAIIGRGIYEQGNPRDNAISLGSKLYEAA